MNHPNSLDPIDAQPNDCDQERLVLDYINGHLESSEKLAFEARLKQDDNLAAVLKQTRQWQTSLHESYDATSAVNPDFAKIEHKLSRKKWGWLLPLAPTALACMVVFTVGDFSKPLNQEFETLTQAPSHQQAILQVILTPEADANAVIEKYNLNVVESFSNQRILNVALTASVDTIQAELLNDERVTLTKKIGASQ